MFLFSNVLSLLFLLVARDDLQLASPLSLLSCKHGKSLNSSEKSLHVKLMRAAYISKNMKDGGISGIAQQMSPSEYKRSASLERRGAIRVIGISSLQSLGYRSANASDGARVSHFTTPLALKNKVLQLSDGSLMEEITDPQTSLSGILYTPASSKRFTKGDKKFPLLIVLHGAGINDIPTAWNVADPSGEHAGLPPSLLACNNAPDTLQDNFFVVSPYSYGKSSLYDEPRTKVIQFIKFVLDCNPSVDRARLYLLGFSDGATLAVELLTTGYFKAGVIAAYGFTGTLPALALQRLSGIPIWVFHSKDDVIYSVSYSDRLVKSLKAAKGYSSSTANNDGDGHKKALIRYTRYEQDPEGFRGAVQGHSTGIAASKRPDVYEWLLSI